MKRIGRLLRMGKNCAAMNMAIDESIMKAQFNDPIPTLRFYDWESPAYSFGYFQDISSEVDIVQCHSDGIDLVKRITGGGTVIHGWDLTYSLIFPRESNELSISETYRYIGKFLQLAFRKIGISTDINYKKSGSISQNNCLVNIAENDVLCNGSKVAGVSVRRNRNGFLYQGYISVDIPSEVMFKNASKNKLIQEQLLDESSAINKYYTTIQRDDLVTVISDTLNFDIQFDEDKITELELETASDLAESKYSTSEWNFNQ
ncbi:lipoate--protein ligase family protein [Candidatus Poribacteria bacterium]|nr:lipoate--protein ligase family protein [Candidatus Poribacteria bacterium]